MHTGHLILVKADNHQDAIDTVRANLDSEEANFARWSDWSVVGNEGFGESRYSFKQEYEDWNGASEYAVGLDEEGELFYKVLDSMYGIREKQFALVKEQVSELGFDSFSLDQDDQDSWALYRFAKLVESAYNPYSFVFDLHNFSANLRYFRDDVSLDKTYPSDFDTRSWYGVLVDFHF